MYQIWREVWGAVLFFLGSGIVFGGKGANKFHRRMDFVVGDIAFEARHVAFSLSDGLDKFSVRFALDRRGPQVRYLQAFSTGVLPLPSWPWQVAHFAL